MLKNLTAVFMFAILISCGVTQVYGAKDDSAQTPLATLYFKIDSAEIDAAFEKDLKKIQTALEADPDMGLRIVGYAQRQGAERKSPDVAQIRVQAVQQWFSKRGIAISRLKTQSFIDRKPPVQKMSDEDTTPGGRVEILQISMKQPLAVVSAPVYQFGAVVEGQEVVHAFIVENKGTAALEIKRVKTD